MLAGGSQLTATGNYDQAVWAVRRQDGAPQWLRTTGGAGNDFAVAGAARGERVFAAGEVTPVGGGAGPRGDWTVGAYAIR